MNHAARSGSHKKVSQRVRMKKGIAVLLTLLLAGGAGGGAYYGLVYRGDGTSIQRRSSGREDAVNVQSVTMLAGLGSGNGRIQRFAGVVEPQKTWSAKLQNEKTVKTTYVKEGDMVKEGQKIFTYDTTEDEDKLAQKQIDLERLQNDVESIKANIEQLKKEKDKASADDQLSYTTNILTQENSLKQDEYEIKTTQLEIGQLEDAIKSSDVHSEIEGIVKSIASASSSNSNNTSEDYITIMAVGEYRVKGTVNEQNINSVYEEERVLAYSRVDPAQYWSGVITEINTDKGTTGNTDGYGYSDSSGDSQNSSTNYPFYIKLDSSEGLMLGQHVYVEADEGQAEAKSGIWLDDFYITVEDDGSAWVWAASERGVLEKRTVVLGRYDEDLLQYEILEGLSAEDYIVQPEEGFQAGMPVNYTDYGMESGEDDFGFGDDGLFEEDGGFDGGMDDFDMGGDEIDALDMDMLGGMDDGDMEEF